jgi:single-stranded DNA-binding protein
LNLVVLIGRVARPIEERTLRSGDRLIAYQLTVMRNGAKAETVPVVWFDAPAHAADHAVEDEVVVVGRVRRRSFEADGGSQSSTEVVADVVLPRRQTQSVGEAIERAAQRLEAARWLGRLSPRTRS